MFACCSGIIAKLVLVVLNVITSGINVHAPACPTSSCSSAIVVVSGSAARDTASATRGGEKEKPVKITISDEGIKIGAEGKEKVILEADMKKLNKINKEVMRKLQSLPESLKVVLGEEENQRHFHEKGGDIVQVGTRIVVEKDELVNGDVVSILSNIVIRGKVTGDVAAVFGSVQLDSTAIVNGEVVSILGDVNREDGAVVRGETAVVGARHPHRGIIWPLGSWGEGMFSVAARIILFIIKVLLMLIVLYFISGRMTKSAEHIGESFLKSFGVGFLLLVFGTILVAILAIILAITIVGIPVAVLVVLSYVALFVLGYFVAALALGRFVAKKLNMESDSVYLQGIIGLFLLSILGIAGAVLAVNPWLIPIRVIVRLCGLLVWFIAVTTGVGAFIISRGGSRPPQPKAAPAA